MTIAEAIGVIGNDLHVERGHPELRRDQLGIARLLAI